MIRPRVLLSAFAVLTALAVLIGLGTWQMQRKGWKEALIERIEERTKAAPIPVTDIGTKVVTDAIGYYRVTATGRFLHDREQYLWSPDPRHGPGFHVYTPLQLQDGRFVLVNRGYVPERLRSPATRPLGQIEGQTTVVGLLRPPAERSMFSPERDAKGGTWYWRDITGMIANAFPGGADKTLSFAIDAEAMPTNPGGWPKGGTTILSLPNRHLEYALTWYGLAVTLVLVVVAAVLSRRRSRQPVTDADVADRGASR